MKTAALSWYADNNELVNGMGWIKRSSDGKFKGEFASTITNGNITPEDILKYLGSTSELTLVEVNNAMVLKDSSGGLYYTDWDYGTDKGKDIDTTKTVKWYIVYCLADKDKSGLKEKMESRMSSVGLVNKRPGKYNLNSSKEEYCFGLLVEDFTQ